MKPLRPFALRILTVAVTIPVFLIIVGVLHSLGHSLPFSSSDLYYAFTLTAALFAFIVKTVEGRKADRK